MINASNRKLQGTIEATGEYVPLVSGTGDKLEGGRFQLGAFGYVVGRQK
ncbi:MAG: hypothetical protein NTW28_17975 [Candidatus Solibacter sp.]|nr:hypothetical protein [Candidatus Solibacter sp.]